MTAVTAIGPRKWIARPGHVLSVAWFVLATSAVIACEVTYGWRSRPLDRWWHATAYAAFFSWLVIARWLERWVQKRQR